MEARVWHSIDKSGWPPGPWQEEPDKAQWEDEQTGLPCLMTRSFRGALCGYVGVPPGHPLHGAERDSLPRLYAPGGITFAGAPEEGDPGRARHFVDGPGDVWLIGFDAGHDRDYCPMDPLVAVLRATGSDGELGVYRDVAYISAGITTLAAQLGAPGGDMTSITHAAMQATAERFGLAGLIFICPKCLAVSASAEDIREGYCGACHEFTARREIAPGNDAAQM